MKIYIDAGTTWTKILKIENDIRDYSVISTRQLKDLDLIYNKSTGHSLNK